MDNKIPNEEEADLSHFFEKPQEAKQELPPAIVVEEGEARPRWFWIAAAMVIAGLSVALWYSLSLGPDGEIKIPAGYQLTSPANGPPQLQKAK